jgi:hypothetical protein
VHKRCNYCRRSGNGALLHHVGPDKRADRCAVGCADNCADDSSADLGTNVRAVHDTNERPNAANERTNGGADLSANRDADDRTNAAYERTNGGADLDTHGGAFLNSDVCPNEAPNYNRRNLQDRKSVV